MRSAADREKFIRGRAEGLSIRKASELVGITRATGDKWDKEYSARISEEKRNRIQELSHEYGLSKASRLECLGKLLKRVEAKVEKIDLEKLPPEKLLDFHVKLLREISREYTPTLQGAGKDSEAITDNLQEKISVLINRISTGELTAEQATAEISIIRAASSVYNDTVTAGKISDLEKRIVELEGILERQNEDN